MTTYKGKDTIKRLLDNKEVLAINNLIYKLDGDKLVSRSKDGGDWGKSLVSLTWLLSNPCKDYKPLPKVGEWVEATKGEEVYKGKVARIEINKVFALWDGNEYETYLNGDDFEFRVLTEEEVDKHELEMVFNRAGRHKKVYEVGDIVKYYKRFAEVVGQTKRDLYGTMYQTLLIQFVVDDRDGNELMMQREVNADEVTPKCFNTNVVKLRKEEERIW